MLICSGKAEYHVKIQGQLQLRNQLKVYSAVTKGQRVQMVSKSGASNQMIETLKFPRLAAMQNLKRNQKGVQG